MVNRGINEYFSLLIGLFLLVQGVWGLLEPATFSVFTLNILHAFLHIILGIMGIYFGWRGKARPYNKTLGALLITVGILRIIPPTSQIMIDFLLMNMAVTYLNLVIGLMSLLFGFLVDRNIRKAWA